MCILRSACSTTLAIANKYMYKPNILICKIKISSRLWRASSTVCREKNTGLSNGKPAIKRIFESLLYSDSNHPVCFASVFFFTAFSLPIALFLSLTLSLPLSLFDIHSVPAVLLTLVPSHLHSPFFILRNMALGDFSIIK